MRALILRRLALIETGAGGPFLIGDAKGAEIPAHGLSYPQRPAQEVGV